MIISALLFLMATMLLTLVVHQQMQTGRQVERETAMHLADAGINAYLYELRRNPNFYVSSPALGPSSLEGGSWHVLAQPPSDTGPLTLRSTGILASTGETRTITATVRFPTFADYMFVANTDINIGRDAVIDGKIRSNGDVDNDGHVTGKVTAAGDVTGSGRFDDGYEERAPRVDFSQVTADMFDMRTAATADGTFFPSSGTYGYRVTVNGTWVDIDRVTGGLASGNLTSTNYDSATIPSSGVFYFDDDVWLSGDYAAKVTFASSGDIYLPDDLQVHSSSSRYTCGVVARQNVIVPSWYPSLPNNMTIDAALLAQQGSIYADMHNGVTRTKLVINGSMSYNQYSYFATYSGNSVVSGFRSRDYNYDPRLDLDPPPMYPQIRDGSLKVQTWFGG